VALTLGTRDAALTVKDNLGTTGLSLKDQWSPRVGLVWDPTQQGHSKIYANYGRYFENIPLDLADRSISAETQIRSNHACDPMQGHSICDQPQNLRSGRNGTISTFWANTGAPFPTPVDPDIKSPSTDEIVAGAEYEVLPNARLGASYTHRNLVRTVEDMSTTGGATFFLGNPGEGIATPFPKAERKYDAVTVVFNKTFADLWLAQVSYTWSHLRGNYDGLFVPSYIASSGVPQLDPNITAIFDFPQFLINATGNLAADVTHTIKVFVAKEFLITPTLSINLGGSFTGNSGPPIDALGADPTYGDGIVYILTRGTPGRMPWVTSFDAKVGVNYRINKDSVVTASVDGFNLFNSQRPILVDNRYTLDFPGPIAGAAQGAIPTDKGYGAVVNPAVYDPTKPYSPTAPGVITPANGSLPRPQKGVGVLLPDPTGATIIVSTNPRWGQATQYQAVRQFRFNLRVTF